MSVLLKDLGNGIKSVIINDPKTYNSLSFKTLGSLIKIFKKLNNDNKTHVIVISGNGKGFSAGHNLKEVRSLKGKSNYNKLFDLCSELMMVITNSNKPVIAKVHGAAFAAGCQLVATCDLAVAEASTKFGVNGVNIGLFCSTPMVALSRNISRKQAFEMLTTGEFITADQAKTLGLVNRIASIDKFEAETEDLAEKIASKLGAAVKIGKEAFYKQLEMPIIEAYEYTGQVMAENMMLRQTEKGINAFLNKLEPAWEQD